MHSSGFSPLASGLRQAWVPSTRAVLAGLLLGALTCVTAGPAKAQLIVSDTSVAYIDPAIPFSQVRLRFDAAFGVDFPDRAEFLYGTWAAATPGAPGPQLRERNVDYQDLSAYVEYAPLPGISIFTDIPTRLLNPDLNQNTAGYADMTAGVKWAVMQDACSVTTLQLKAYIPTGDADRGLGVDHASLEPGLLLMRRLTDCLVFEGEVRDWIPIGGTDGFAGNVLRYGGGLGYFRQQPSCCWSAGPVVEAVGWTVLNGRKTNVDGIFDAGGDTIVNLKAGMRVRFGGAGGYRGGGDSLYVGYGRALTGETWYRDVLRAELRLVF